MDRFEVSRGNGKQLSRGNLHSSMDRFEDNTTRNATQKNKNLHSSMDRFEVSVYDIAGQKLQIYIPVWIDLKPKGTKLYKNKILFTFQYG